MDGIVHNSRHVAQSTHCMFAFSQLGFARSVRVMINTVLCLFDNYIMRPVKCKCACGVSLWLWLVSSTTQMILTILISFHAWNTEFTKFSDVAAACLSPYIASNFSFFGTFIKIYSFVINNLCVCFGISRALRLYQRIFFSAGTSVLI